ncbi:MAG: acyloxyacyl hydrolase [Gammaproteobacteria bacterium]
MARFFQDRLNSLSLHLIGSGNFIVYSERFPAGGDYYNFMRRAGPMVKYKIGNSMSIGLSYQQSHVSNGQGLSSRNPSYDAHGFALRVASIF